MRRAILGVLVISMVFGGVLPADAVLERPWLKRSIVRERRREQLRREVGEDATTAGRVLKGTGTLTAEGKGRVRFFGSGKATVSGRGSLNYKDLAGDAQVSVSGSGQRHEHRRTGVTHYHHFKGSVTVSGSKHLLKMTGIDISVSAEGTGVVTLRGRGTYTANSRTGSWSGRKIQIGSST